jgi:hypothetical protein
MMAIAQRVFESRRAGAIVRKRKRRPRVGLPRVDRGSLKRCRCGKLHFGQTCPRCSGLEQLTARGRGTMSAKRMVTTEFSGSTLAIEAIVLDAPAWVQKVLRRRFQFKQPDSGACQDLRMRKSLYREEVRAAVEYVAQLLEQRGTRH